MPAACSQCENPMLKGIHSCGRDGAQAASDHDAPNLVEAVMDYLARCGHKQGADPISVLTAHMASGGPQGVQFGCTCGSSGAHYPPCPFAPAPQATPFVPAPQTPGFQFTGWVCPVCGGGVGPFVQRCPCRPVDGVSVVSPQPITKGV